MGKICNKCLLDKPVQEFSKNKKAKDGLQWYCKSCSKIVSEKYKEKSKVYSKNWRLSNPNKAAESSINWRKSNSEKSKSSSRKWYSKNKAKRKTYIKQYLKDNKDRVLDYRKSYVKRRYKDDPIFKLKIRVRNIIYKTLKNKGFTKLSESFAIIGCSPEKFKIHMESLFLEGMTWKNYGEWHIDHKKPISLATTEKEIYELNYYTNLQPMWAIDNLKKGNKYE